MSFRTPYILLSFANPLNVPEHYLPSLTQESRITYQHLEQYDFKDICDINRIENTTIEDLFNTIEKWQKYKDLWVFHYGGHASGAQLLLTTENSNSKSINALGLSKLLGSLPSLKLVFLNGCSTYEQVQLLLDQGVKAVIATSEPIKDKMATDFADRFYQNLSSGESIKESFERAKSFITSKYEDEVFLSEKHRDFVIEDFDSINEENKSLPWGLYHQKGVESDLNWSLPQKSKAKSLFGDVDKFTCDRYEQTETFKVKFDSHKFTKKVQTYFIHGDEMQSPRGLFKRFVFKEIIPTYHKVLDKIVNVQEATTLEGAKIEFTSSLFDALNMDHRRLPPQERTLKKAIEAPVLREIDSVVIKFKYYSTAWKPFTGEFIRWFLGEFINEINIPKQAPNFIFFFSIVYVEDSKNKGFMNRLFSKSPKEKILTALQKPEFSEITILKELPPVKRIDISQWMDKVSDDPIEKNEQMDLHFPKQEEYEMAKVERELGKIIEKYNEKNIK